MRTDKKLFIIGACLSFIAALLHIAIIIGGAEWYRFFGAGEMLATLAEQGSYYPAMVTSGIAVVLTTFAAYALSGAGVIKKLPLLKLALLIISFIYLLRGLAVIPIAIFMPNLIDSFVIYSSIVCLIYGLCYSIALKLAWHRL